MDFAAAAGFAIAYGTSYGALTWRADIKPGELLLVLGAAGGVGLTAVEIGKALGARVIACAGGAEKLAIAKAHGADFTIDYREENLRGRLREISDGVGVDVVYDPVGGESFDIAMRSTNWNGRLIVVGFAGGTVPQIPANILLVKNLAALGFYWGSYRFKQPALLAPAFAQMFEWWQQGKLKPRISGRYDLAEVKTALTSGGGAQGHRQDRADDRIMSDPVADQYEAYPYPSRNPQDEKTRLIDGSPSNLDEVDHYIFAGARDFRLPFRALVAGGGTGDAAILLAQNLADRNCPAEIHYLDLSAASRRIAEARAKVRGLSNIRFHTGSLLDLPRLDLGRFDYIDCCGVLHHLADPPAGLAALGAAMAPDGGMGLMLYGALGRSGVYRGAGDAEGAGCRS